MADKIKDIEQQYNFEELKAKQDSRLKIANNETEQPTERKFKVTPTKSVYEIALGNLNSIDRTNKEQTINITFDEARLLFQNVIALSGKNLIYKDSEKEIIRNIIKYFINDSTGIYDIKKGLYIYGYYRSGKTQLMQLFQAFTNLINFNKFDKINYKILNDRIKIQGIKAAENISKYKSLFVDDLGFLNESKINSYGNTFDLLMSIVNERYERWFYSGMKTHYTSNIMIKDIEEIYGEGISGRLINSCNIIKFSETNHSKL